MRRLFDILFSIILLFLFSPVFVLIPILIKLTSRGTVFYSQERIGLYKKPFKILKFRSMRMDAEKEGPQLSHPQDSRVTSIGMFLRNSKIDELPQLINVLIGNMSFVGPRPERQFFIDEIVKSSPEFEELLMVKPGITSLGQVQYGYAMCVEEMLERMTLDLKYVRNRSAGFDVKILWLTLFFLMKKLKG